MSVTTKRGDDGKTDLLFGRRIEKASPLMAAMGLIDELNAALGLVRVSGIAGARREQIDGIQEKLVGLMGELATHPEDSEKYDEAGYPRVGDADVDHLEAATRTLEADMDIRFKGWARPGKEACESAARLDYARTVCRRAEQGLWSTPSARNAARLFLNRLSDLLWVMARAEALEAGQTES